MRPCFYGSLHGQTSQSVGFVAESQDRIIFITTNLLVIFFQFHLFCPLKTRILINVPQTFKCLFYQLDCFVHEPKPISFMISLLNGSKKLKTTFEKLKTEFTFIIKKNLN